jgi:hypothetical protein
MNPVRYKPPVYHEGPSHPIAIVVDAPQLDGVIDRTPHVFGGIPPLLDVSSRIAAGLDPRSFLRPEETWNPEASDGEAMMEAVDRAASVAAAYAHRLMIHCNVIGQMEVEQAQKEVLEAEQAQRNGQANGRVQRP